jgi:ankyrin repeat protein
MYNLSLDLLLVLFTVLPSTTEMGALARSCRLWRTVAAAPMGRAALIDKYIDRHGDRALLRLLDVFEERGDMLIHHWNLPDPALVSMHRVRIACAHGLLDRLTGASSSEADHALAVAMACSLKEHPWHDNPFFSDQNFNGSSALALAIRTGDPSLARRLLALNGWRGVQLDYSNNQERSIVARSPWATAVMCACYGAPWSPHAAVGMDLVTDFLARDVKADTQCDYFRSSALVVAAASPYPRDLMLLLLKYDCVDPNQVDDMGRTPLHYATTRDAARILLGAGANPTPPSVDFPRLIPWTFQQTPLYMAVSMGRLAVLRVLTNLTDLHARFEKGKTVLHIAQHHDVMQFLLMRGLDANATDDDGSTPLHSLLNYNGPTGCRDMGSLPGMVQLLLDAGADVRQRDAAGRSPLDLAEQLERPVVLIQVAVAILRQAEEDAAGIPAIAAPMPGLSEEKSDDESDGGSQSEFEDEGEA